MMNGYLIRGRIPSSRNAQLTPLDSCWTGGASLVSGAVLPPPPKKILERPCPMTEPATAAPVLAAI